MIIFLVVVLTLDVVDNFLYLNSHDHEHLDFDAVFLLVVCIVAPDTSFQAFKLECSFMIEFLNSKESPQQQSFTSYLL